MGKKKDGDHPILSEMEVRYVPRAHATLSANRRHSTCPLGMAWGCPRPLPFPNGSQIAELRELFYAYGGNKKGILEVADLMALLRSIGEDDPSEAMALKMIEVGRVRRTFLFVNVEPST